MERIFFFFYLYFQIYGDVSRLLLFLSSFFFFDHTFKKKSPSAICNHYLILGRPGGDYAKQVDLKMSIVVDIETAVSFLQSHPEVMGNGSKGVAQANALDGNKIKFKVAETGGPSGGLVFSIGLVELLTEIDLMQGRHIAGTGTINDRGIVGAIGGINEKIHSAQKVGATLFFAPVDNAQEIANVPKGIKVITVATLAQAVSYLERTRK
jgi:PDZ domain-containing secreted protein